MDIYDSEQVHCFNLSKQTLISLLKRFLISSNIVFISEDQPLFEHVNSFTIRLNKKNLKLHVILKNISYGGWKEKPLIKRIQVASLEGKKIPEISMNEIFILGGFCYVNDKPILVGWNPFRFTYHKTNRSCYVNVYSILKVNNLGFLISNDFKKEEFICDELNFDKLLIEYVKYCGVTY